MYKDLEQSNPLNINLNSKSLLSLNYSYSISEHSLKRIFEELIVARTPYYSIKGVQAAKVGISTLVGILDANLNIMSSKNKFYYLKIFTKFLKCIVIKNNQ